MSSLVSVGAVPSSSILRLHRHDTEADVIRAPLGLEALPEGRAGGTTVVGPGAAPARPGEGAVPVGRSHHGGKIRISAAGQLQVKPIAAPLDNIAMHVMQTPWVGGIAADLGGAIEGRPFLGSVIRLALEICLLAAQLIAERRGGLRSRAA